MKADQYIAKARLNADKLRSLLGNFHPRSAAYARNHAKFRNKITAPGAQAACANVAAKIQQEEANEPHPIALFNIALEVGNLEAAQKIDQLLNEAWFGVPESTSCWSIPGFSQAVDLMEDPPDE